MERGVGSDDRYKPISFLSFDTPWASQQTEDGIQVLQDAVANAIDFGAEVIAIAGLGFTSLCNLFNRSQLPSQAQITELEDEVKEFLESNVLPHAQACWKSSVAQPDCVLKCTATCAAIYLESFADTVEYCNIVTESNRPALGMTFHRRGQTFCVFTVYWMQTPNRAKGRMLNAYLQFAKDACNAEQPQLLIGGSFDIGSAKR